MRVDLTNIFLHVVQRFALFEGVANVKIDPKSLEGCQTVLPIEDEKCAIELANIQQIKERDREFGQVFGFLRLAISLDNIDETQHSLGYHIALEARSDFEP